MEFGPTIGLCANHAATLRWLLSDRMDLMGFNLSSFNTFGYQLKNLSGQVFRLEASAKQRLTENLVIGAAYGYMKKRVVAAASQPSVTVTQIARRYDLDARRVSNWMKKFSSGIALVPHCRLISTA